MDHALNSIKSTCTTHCTAYTQKTNEDELPDSRSLKSVRNAGKRWIKPTKKKTKALKIEMEIKRSEMWKILLFFFHSISFTFSLFVRLFGHRCWRMKRQTKKIQKHAHTHTMYIFRTANEPTTFYVEYLTRSWCSAVKNTTRKWCSFYVTYIRAAHHYELHCGRSVHLFSGYSLRVFGVCTNRISFRLMHSTLYIFAFECLNCCVCCRRRRRRHCCCCLARSLSYCSFYVLLPILV